MTGEELQGRLVNVKNNNVDVANEASGVSVGGINLVNASGNKGFIPS